MTAHDDLHIVAAKAAQKKQAAGAGAGAAATVNGTRTDAQAETEAATGGNAHGAEGAGVDAANARVDAPQACAILDGARAALAGVETLAALRIVTDSALKALGAQWYGLAQVTLPGGQPCSQFLMSPPGADWTAVYKTGHLWDYDPSVSYIRAHYCVKDPLLGSDALKLPYFQWSDLVLLLDGVTDMQRSFLDQAAQHGLDSGFVTPISLPDYETAHFTVAGLQIVMSSTAERARVHQYLAAFLGQVYTQFLVLARLVAPSEAPAEAPPEAPAASLSAGSEHIRLLQLLSYGMTADSIAAQMGVSAERYDRLSEETCRIFDVDCIEAALLAAAYGRHIQLQAPATQADGTDITGAAAMSATRH